jgi:hypothetical protein
MGFWDWLMGTPGQAGTTATGKKAVSATKRTSALHIEVGDVVAYDTVDYVVKNKISYDDEGFEWFDYMLVDDASGTELWLSAEDDDGLELGIYREVQLPDGIPPVPRTVTIDGVAYKQYEQSDARVTVEREDPTRSTHSEVEYWEYKAPGEKFLTITRWGGEYEASVGASIEEFELKVYPGNRA